MVRVRSELGEGYRCINVPAVRSLAIWLTVAMSTTLAGNTTLLASVANLIAAETGASGACSCPSANIWGRDR